MFKFKTISEQLIDERKKNQVLSVKLEKVLSDMDYIAMMCDVELEEENDEQI